MRLTTFTVGLRLFQASVLRYGKLVDDGSGDCWTERGEAESEGDWLASDYDPEWQKRYPDAISFVVRCYEVSDVSDDGREWSGWTVD